MSSVPCSVCNTPMRLKHSLRFHVYECKACGLLSSDAGFDHSFSSYDEESRTVGLEQLRRTNFRKIIAALNTIKGNSLQTLVGLEIGSGNGWWLEVCKAHNITCSGIEPEETFRPYHEAHQLDVVYGFYPEVSKQEGQQKDFIIFNDVFEHIPAINDLVVAIKNDLKPDGILIINIPMSSGFFYRVATWLSKWGITSFLERLWQFNFHSPHMNYFNDHNLEALMQQHGLECIHRSGLLTLDFTSLRERILTDSSIGKFKAFFLSNGLRLLKPVITSTKPDIKVFFFRRKQ